jgi:tight adherence protein C
MPLPVMALLGLAVFALSIPAFRGCSDLLDALRRGELPRLASPVHWTAVRAFCGLMAALPVGLAARSLEAGALGASAVVAMLGYAVAPQFLHAARRRVEQAMLDELALHLELMALVLESGGSLSAAIAACIERAPDGPLRRAWGTLVVETCNGTELTEALKNLDQRLGLRPVSRLVATIRNERAAAALPLLMRERARQAAAGRFARAERLARAAPLKLWATLMLCLAPCTLLVLAFPMAEVLVVLLDR